jgi:hypothetical protein
MRNRKQKEGRGDNGKKRTPEDRDEEERKKKERRATHTRQVQSPTDKKNLKAKGLRSME